jgi:hypothetical protein
MIRESNRGDPHITINVWGMDYRYDGMEFQGSEETCCRILEAIRALLNGWPEDGA